MPSDEEDLSQDEFSPDVNALTAATIGAAIEVHRILGPGLDESLYERALCIELDLRRISFVRQVAVQVGYKNEIIGEKRLDLIVEHKLVVEIKAIEKLTAVHSAQLNTYLKITRLPLGLLINFNEFLLKDGIKRVIRSVCNR